jgi:hypothetical protein
MIPTRGGHLDCNGCVWISLPDGWRYITSDTGLSEDVFEELPPRYAPFVEIDEPAVNLLRQALLVGARIFRPATIEDYVRWLRCWLAAGNQPNAFFNNPFNSSCWRVAIRDFAVPCSHGTGSGSIIIPPEIRVVEGDRGHNQLYFHHGPSQRGNLIPIYSDAIFADVLDVDEFRSQLSWLRGGRSPAPTLPIHPE